MKRFIGTIVEKDGAFCVQSTPAVWFPKEEGALS